ncbi:uncharacterized protein LOC133316884 [Gastrolobium bilobum]|uniref:uncharacterized protein LOC133316884 n=1 Tax=Gastrolobium bilobum TaxID=150636 RepID=UPI002AB27C1C|nr:uncharacterized protein LOC133316884 [Gastrolobium bilobum]
MAVDLHTGDSYLFLLPDKQEQHTLPPHDLNHNNNNNNINGSDLKPKVLIPHEFGSHINQVADFTEAQGNDKEDDLVAELTRQMAHFMLQDDHKFDFSCIGSQNLESQWDSISSLQSTLWSPLGKNQRSPEGSSQESLPLNNHDSCWENTNNVVGMFEKMKLDERGDSKYHPGYGIQSLETSNVGVSSYQSLIQQQIRADQLSRLRKEHILSLKQKLTAYRENHVMLSQQFQKKGKGVVDVGSVNGRRIRPPRPAPPPPKQAGSEMLPLFLGKSGSRGTPCGTGVFLPRGGTSAPSESRKRPGKGCSTVLIPARVVQALQLHFDQMAATSGPKAGGFPPLHDVLVSDRAGMYSLQKRQSRKKQANIESEMILPQEWTY